MKIAIAQIKSEKGNIKSNIKNHIKWINIAISNKADLIIFPELSLTGYEPELAKALATNQDDLRLDVFQRISNEKKIAIGIGLPIKSEPGIFISMVIFQPNRTRMIYSKQKLHPDEFQYFVPGNKQIILKIKNTNIAPAICFESLQAEHSEKAVQLGAEIYLASVAKSQKSVEKAYMHFSYTAKKYAMPVLMSNCVGYCDGYVSAGQTSIWDENGILVENLDNKSEGLLIYDTKTKKAKKKQKPQSIK